jgi:hypothetical protein
MLELPIASRNLFHFPTPVKVVFVVKAVFGKLFAFIAFKRIGKVAEGF